MGIHSSTSYRIVNLLRTHLSVVRLSKMSQTPYQTELSGRILLATLVACCLLSYGIGIVARSVLVDGLLKDIERNLNEAPLTWPEDYLPTPTVSESKVVPTTIYTSKNFDTRSSVISSQWLKNNGRKPDEPSEIKAPINAKLIPINNETDYAYDADDEEHLPAGQHLLIDIDGVDGSFLNSEKELATAMLDMVDNSGLTLLSYHCHGLQPSGVTCVGVLLESHVSFHTWPAEGVITLDLFTCGSTSLLNHLQLIQRLFAIPMRGSVNPVVPKVLWAYKRRGFKEQSGNVGSRDTFAYPLGIHGIEMKEEIASVVTEQGKQGWVYDIQRSTKGTQYADSSRFFYLDGVLKSSSDEAPASYESFVHPSMLVHPDPKRVLAFGSTTGAIVKEILKHKSVEDIALVGVDKTLLQFASQNLHAWNDCSEIVSVENCLDDPRVKVIDGNPNMWPHDNYLGASSPDMAFDRLADVVLVDFSELEEEVTKDIVAGSNSFLSGLKKILHDDGVLVLNVVSRVRAVDSRATTQVASLEDPNDHGQILENLTELGFTVKQYTENQPGFSSTKNYIVAFVDDGTARNWNRNEAQVNRIFRERFANTRSGKPPLEFFDASTMVSYSRYEQGVDDCADHPDPRWCDIKRQLAMSQLSSEHLFGGLRTLGRIEFPNASRKVDLPPQHCIDNDIANGEFWRKESPEQRRFVAHESS